MKYKPSRAFIVCMILGGAGAWVWQKLNSTPLHLRTTSTFLELLRYEEVPPLPPFNPPTPEEIAQTRQATQVLMAKLTGEFPALRIDEHPVSDAQNAFLLLHQLSKRGQALPLSQEFRQLLSDEIPWNAETAVRCLNEHADLISRIESIASLPTRSSADMPDDYDAFINARVAKDCVGILLTKARLAAEAKDQPEVVKPSTQT
jgi:hypothetical protein